MYLTYMYVEFVLLLSHLVVEEYQAQGDGLTYMERFPNLVLCLFMLSLAWINVCLLILALLLFPIHLYNMNYLINTLMAIL